ncbi:YheC/YheD family protein [Microbacteriaceae bacterium 4G12]
MTIIFYNPRTKSWHHPQHEYQFGRTTITAASITSCYPFPVRKQDNRVGPLIGILTSGSTSHKVYGDFQKFSSIQFALEKRGGVSFVFTPHGVQENYIEGYILQANKWRKCSFPYPDVIYNRIPYRKDEKELTTLYAFTRFQERNLPFFNPSFFSKWEVYQIFRTNPKLHAHLLETRLLLTKQDLLDMLLTYKAVYVKSSESAKGEQLFKVERLSSEMVQIQSPSIKPIRFSTKEIWKMIDYAKQKLIIQPALIHDQYNGRKYDLRIPVHLLREKFTIGGIGVRLAALGSIVTHIPHGGEIIAVNALSRPVDHLLLEQLADECGQSLCSLGRVREFSLDIGVDQRGHYYIFEVNAKPMSFDEPHIQQQILEHLLLVFDEEAGFLE